MEALEIIENITEFSDERYAGYKIRTTKQTITIQIDNQPLCCEDWGYICTDDQPNDYIDAELKDIFVVDLDMKSKKAKLSKALKCEDFFMDSGDAVFVNVVTNRGDLQFVLYNTHNGFYGHTVEIISEQLDYGEVI